MHPTVDGEGLVRAAKFYGFALDAEVAARVAGPLQALLGQCDALWASDLEHVPLSLTLPDSKKD